MTWLDEFVHLCQQNLKERDDVREEYWSRGVDDNQIDRYRLGYVNTLPSLVPQAFVEWSREGERTNHSYVLPLTNSLREIQGFQFRSVDREKSGYMNYFATETEPVYFGLGEACPEIFRTERVVLVEGAFDLFPIQRVTPEVVATLTAKTTKPFARLLKRLAKRVYLSYDRDEAGKRGLANFIREHGPSFEEVSDIDYPEIRLINGKLAKDPSDIWEAWGDDQLGAFLRCILPSILPTTEPSYAPEPFQC